MLLQLAYSGQGREGPDSHGVAVYKYLVCWAASFLELWPEIRLILGLSLSAPFGKFGLQVSEHLVWGI